MRCLAGRYFLTVFVDREGAEAGALLSLAASDAKQVGGIADLMCRGSGAVVSFVAVGVGMMLASPLLGVLPSDLGQADPQRFEAAARSGLHHVLGGRWSRS